MLLETSVAPGLTGVGHLWIKGKIKHAAVKLPAGGAGPRNVELSHTATLKAETRGAGTMETKMCF